MSIVSAWIYFHLLKKLQKVHPFSIFHSSIILCPNICGKHIYLAVLSVEKDEIL